MIGALLLAVLPGRLHRWVRARRGQAIHPSVRLRFGVVIVASDVFIGAGASVGPFVVVRATSLRLGAESTIRPCCSLAAHTIRIGANCVISQFNVVTGDTSQARSHLVLGDHTRIFPLCWLEAGYGISLGSRVGIGGHGLIFTHGSWANYFLGAPVAFGPVTIEDRVWLPWRVFVMPNVVIGKAAILGAGSVVTKSVPAGAFAAGSPATVVRREAYTDLTSSALNERIADVVHEFESFGHASAGLRIAVFDAKNPDPEADVVIGGTLDPVTCRERLARGVSSIDLVEERLWLAEPDHGARELATFLTRYGVRVDRQPSSWSE